MSTSVKIVVNSHRELKEFPEMVEGDRIRFCFDKADCRSQYVEVYFADGQLWLFTDQGLVIQCHSGNQAIVIPAAWLGGSVTNRLLQEAA